MNERPRREKGRVAIKPSQAAAIRRLRAIVRVKCAADPTLIYRQRTEWPLLWEAIEGVVGEDLCAAGDGGSG